MRYRFKGIVRTTGQSVEGHAHGETPDEALAALSEHGIVTESLREDPEPLNLATQQTPFGSRIDSALDTAASQVPFDKLADRFKGKNVWVLDRDKIRRGVAQVVDQALRDALSDGATGGAGANLDAGEIRKQVSDAISGLFKDNKNLTSEVSQGSSMKLDHAVDRIEQMVRRAESVLAQMTVAIGRMGSGGGGGGWGGPRRFGGRGSGGGGEQNAVLMEIFKENLKLRGIEIDEKPSGDAKAGAPAPAAPAPAAAPARPASPLEGGGAGGGNNNH